MKDYYAILGVPQDASQDDILKAFRELAMEYHPDTAQGDKKDGGARMKEVNEAYKVLRDADSRRKYDEERVRFKRESADARVVVSVSYEKATLGGEKEVRTPDGRRIVVTIPEDTRDRRMIRLKGQGKPVYGSASGRGDLYITVRVEAPRNKSERERIKHIRGIMREFSVNVSSAKLIDDYIRIRFERLSKEKGRSIEELKSRNKRLRSENGRLSKRYKQLEREYARLRRENVKLGKGIENSENKKRHIIEVYSNKVAELTYENVQLREFIGSVPPVGSEYPGSWIVDDAFDYPPTDAGIMDVPDYSGTLTDYDPYPLRQPEQDPSMRMRAGRRKRNAPKPSPFSDKRSSGRFGSLGSDVGSLRKDVGSRKKRR